MNKINMCVCVQLTFGNDETMCCIFPCMAISWMTRWFFHIPPLWIYSTSFFRLQKVMCINDRRWNEALKSSLKKLKFLQVYNNNVIVKVDKRYLELIFDNLCCKHKLRMHKKKPYMWVLKRLEKGIRLCFQPFDAKGLDMELEEASN
jgi:hypothetical protein